jgi:hypothetical protein
VGKDRGLVGFDFAHKLLKQLVERPVRPRLPAGSKPFAHAGSVQQLLRAVGEASEIFSGCRSYRLFPMRVSRQKEHCRNQEPEAI